MDTIKFRGRSKKDSQYVYGYFYKVGKGNDEKYFIKDEEGNDIEINPVTLGQFTGIYDRDGKEIYEGDIVRYFDIKEYYSDEEDYNDNSEIDEDEEEDYSEYNEELLKNYVDGRYLEEYKGVVRYFGSRFYVRDREGDYTLDNCGLDDYVDVVESVCIFDVGKNPKPDCDVKGFQVTADVLGIKVIGTYLDNPELID